MTAHGAQLMHRIFVGKRLTQALFAQYCDLVRAYDQRIRMTIRHGIRFFQREPPRGLFCAFTRLRRFVYVRSSDLKRELQAAQELATVN